MAEGGGIPESIDARLRVSSQTLDQLSQFITTELGIKMPASKVSMIQSRLQRRVRDLGLASLDEYSQHLFSPAGVDAERANFINAFTTNKTDFFREPRHFDYLAGTVLPELARNGSARDGSDRDGRIALWSAGCSSGEEPYTLAMVLSEYALSHPAMTFRILATDVSTKVLETGKQGIYARQLIAPVPAGLRRKYLLQGKGEERSVVRIRAELRQTISFHALNFMDADYGVREMFDVIFCRNVLIYFERSIQQAVIGKLCRNLNPGGYLFVSHSESLSGMDLPLDSLGSSCFRRQRG